MAFKRYLSRQFSIAYDVYLQVRSRVDSMVQFALRRDGPDWRLRHACPACTYTLENEPDLTFKMLYAMDGNDSLKRVHRKLVTPEGLPGESCELPTGSTLTCSRYLSRDFVNTFAAKKDTVPASNEV